MDGLRLGLALRALRRRRGWTQLQLGAAAGVSQTTISRVERGHVDDLSFGTVRRVLASLDARLDARVAWRGGEIDRLLDERHAAAVTAQAAELQRLGWETATEVTFNHYGERGSIDLLGWQAGERVALVVEVKSELTSVEETLRRLDTKVRLAPDLVAERWGARPSRVVPMLAMIDTSANWKRVARVASLFGVAFPMRGHDVVRWLADPASAVPRGLLRFLSIMRPGNGIRMPHRIRSRRHGRAVAGRVSSRISTPRDEEEP